VVTGYGGVVSISSYNNFGKNYDRFQAASEGPGGRNPNWAPDPNKPIEKQLQGKGQLNDLRRNPNIEKGVDVNDLLSKTPMELEEMRRRGEISDKTLKQIKKAFEGRDLGGKGKNK
ncbi:MAG: hypothetical protein FWG40_12815, partial [Peptococcaceae bacterium]|nr:hypothetical protein [Peptococcaceae bacterium]